MEGFVDSRLLGQFAPQYEVERSDPAVDPHDPENIAAMPAEKVGESEFSTDELTVLEDIFTEGPDVEGEVVPEAPEIGG